MKTQFFRITGLMLVLLTSSSLAMAQAHRQQLDPCGDTSKISTDHFQFKDEEGGKGITKDGNHFSFHSYTSNDGVKLLTYVEMLKSAKLAKRALDEKLKEATSTSSRGPKLGKNGQRIGERVVLTVQKKAQGEAESESFVCWTIGSTLHWIQSKSLKHALAFEKTLDPD